MRSMGCVRAVRAPQTVAYLWNIGVRWQGRYGLRGIRVRVVRRCVQAIEAGPASPAGPVSRALSDGEDRPSKSRKLSARFLFSYG